MPETSELGAAARTAYPRLMMGVHRSTGFATGAAATRGSEAFAHARRAARAAAIAAVAILLGAGAGCDRSKPAPAARDTRPNILWIVWDTARADRLGVYGCERPTTPFLDEWAKQARVFDDCVAAGPTTISSHASMFTGRFPTEHGADETQQYLNTRYPTIAELLARQGYQTYMYSANPRVSRTTNLARGFTVEEHPWDPKYGPRAVQIIAEKVYGRDRTSDLTDKLRAAKLTPWDIKASGELAQEALGAWLARCSRKRPYFAFLNYMEAHRPYIPREAYRRRMMTPDEVSRSYGVDRSWERTWAYTFGLTELSDDELALTSATYDATIAELDDLLKSLIEMLRAGGYLENTVVIVTADHGEQLGEHHMLDHQYSVYGTLVHVPLIIHDPARFTPGREERPVVNVDLFPTVLALAGVAPPEDGGHGVNLLSPGKDRPQLAEYPSAFPAPIAYVRARHPDWDASPWQRSLRAFIDGRLKLIVGSDGRRELYDLRTDPLETKDLAEPRADDADRLVAAMDALAGSLSPTGTSGTERPAMTDDDRKLLEMLGYVEPSASSAPASSTSSPASTHPHDGAR